MLGQLEIRSVVDGMKDLLKFLLGFLPWIAFGALAGPSLIKLETALVVSLALTVAVGFRQLRLGFVLTWGTLLFFLVNTVLVLGFKNVWVMKHMGLLAPGTLAAIAWLSLAVGKPFVLQFAAQNVPRSTLTDPGFIANCRHLTLVWAGLFLFSTAVALAKYKHVAAPEWLYHSLSICVIVAGIAYTEWRKRRARRGRPDRHNREP